MHFFFSLELSKLEGKGRGSDGLRQNHSILESCCDAGEDWGAQTLTETNRGRFADSTPGETSAGGERGGY